MKIINKTIFLIMTAVILCVCLYSCTNINYRDFGVNDLGNIVGFLVMGTKSDDDISNDNTDITDNTENIENTGNTENTQNFIDPAENTVSEVSTVPTEPANSVDTEELTAPPETTPPPPPPETTEPPQPTGTYGMVNIQPEIIRLADVFRDVPERFKLFGFPTSLRVTDNLKRNIRNLDNFLTRDFGGTPFYVMTTEPKFFLPSDFGGGTLSDARRYRTSFVSTMYNVTNFGVIFAMRETIVSDIERRVNAGDYIADIICVPLDIQSRLIQKGLLINMKKIPFVNLSAEYYNQSAAEAFAVNNNVYGVVSDVTFEPDNIYAMFYNRSLIRQYNLPNPVELYTNNSWTYDSMFSLIKSITAAASDLNNPAETEIYGAGFNKENNDIINGLFMSSGIKFFAQRAYNFPYLSFNNEKSLKIIESLSRLFAPQSESGMANYLYADDESQRNAFKEGKVLFSISKLDILPEITDISFDWGIVPVPTVDGRNSKLSFTSGDAMCISVLKGTQNSEISGIMTESLAMMSYDYVEELYIQEQMLYSLRDVESVKVLNDIIRGETFNQYSVFSTVDEIYNATVGAVKSAANGSVNFGDIYELNKMSLNVFFNTAKYFERN